MPCPDQIFEDYLALEKAGNARPEGADANLILATVADKHKVTVTHVRDVVRELNSTMGAG